MNERDVCRVIMRDRYRPSFCLHNYTPKGWWECDVFEVTPAGYFREYEVKLTARDFRVDVEKARERWPNGYTRDKVSEKKHDLLAAGDPFGPTAFFYVAPANLIEVQDVPPWAGLIGIVGPPNSLSEVLLKPAPRLHSMPIADAIYDHARGVCYYRLHDLIQKQSHGRT